MPKNDKRVKITLECTVCKRRNYITMKSKINDRERLEMKKYCSHDRQHTRIASHPSEGSSSAGRASVSKTDGRGFESLLPCPPKRRNASTEPSAARCHWMT